MPVTILVGAQWGDEGKGRVVDWLAGQYEVVARYAGGDNAGHTVTIDDETFKLHLIPSGILQKNVQMCVLGHGMVINPKRFIEEKKMLTERGIEVSAERLVISDRSHIITPGHIALDTAREESLGDDAIGTTKRGIGPAYTDKVLRKGIQAGQMLDEEGFAEAVHEHVQEVNTSLARQFPTVADKLKLDAKQVASLYVDYARQIAPHITNTTPVVHKALEANKGMLCEGAQGTLLDIDAGHFPFVTSSSPAAGGAMTGLGFGPTKVNRVVGVTKAFSTRVGSGPMPTELNDATGDRLRGTGENPWDEYGTTTGRPRRCGWFDGVILKYAARVNGFTELVLTKLDILSGFESLNVAVGYEIDGKRTEDLPSSVAEMERATPIYETLRGWTEDIMDCRTWDDLPKTAQDYVQFIADMIGVPISFISVGPERSQIILM